MSAHHTPAPAAFRLRNTSFRRQPHYEFHSTEALAFSRQESFNRSVDDGGLYELTPIYEHMSPAVHTLLVEALDLIPRMSDDDPITPALRDWCRKVNVAIADATGSQS